MNHVLFELLILWCGVILGYLISTMARRANQLEQIKIALDTIGITRVEFDELVAQVNHLQTKQVAR